MNYIVLSPYYPKNFQQFSIELAKQGITVLGIGQEPYDQLGKELQDALTEYFRVEDLENIEEVKKAVAFLFYKHGPIDRIESLNEYWLEKDAILREQFNVFGMKPSELKKTKFKSEMKKYFKKAGVPVVPGQVIKNEKHMAKAVKEIGFPMIAKPDNGVGAAGTYKLLSQSDLDTFKEKWDGETVYFFEQFIDSNHVCTYDGLIDTNGNIVFETTLDYVHPPIELVNDDKENAFYVSKVLDSKLQEYGRAIISTFKMKERFFHIEFFRVGDDYIALEYNNRPAGGFALDVYNYAHSIDLYRDYARVVAGKEVEERQFEPQYCLAVSRRNRLSYIQSEEEIRSTYADKLKAVKKMPKAFADLQGDLFFIFTTQELGDIQEMLNFIGEKS
ncbi:ATP-grasp domain-containing protein [Streptococcus cameli]